MPSLINFINVTHTTSKSVMWKTNLTTAILDSFKTLHLQVTRHGPMRIQQLKLLSPIRSPQLLFGICDILKTHSLPCASLFQLTCAWFVHTSPFPTSISNAPRLSHFRCMSMFHQVGSKSSAGHVQIRLFGRRVAHSVFARIRHKGQRSRGSFVSLRRSLFRIRSGGILAVRERKTPDTIRAEASTRVSRLQAAINSLGDGVAKAKKALESSLAKAQKQAEVPHTRQIGETREFIAKARKRILHADEKIHLAEQAVAEAKEEEEYDWRELAQGEEMPAKKFRREEFVPGCVEELVEWMGCRQQEMNSADAFGRDSGPWRKAQCSCNSGPSPRLL